ncbi:hypothetical protein Vretimale_8241 [Volvox reticuliferus]|uniref:Uncharacterized protein n=1 Tax=Volvox reticuliferus TaxID=1737510 RepID=A0A8J4LNF4_9CHLO|nr:hypothetical protein Vretimale_8241 [Volvox reticuliferus]
MLTADPYFSAARRVVPGLSALLALRGAVLGEGAALSSGRFLYETVGELLLLRWSSKGGCEVVPVSEAEAESLLQMALDEAITAPVRSLQVRSGVGGRKPTDPWVAGTHGHCTQTSGAVYLPVSWLLDGTGLTITTRPTITTWRRRPWRRTASELEFTGLPWQGSNSSESSSLRRRGRMGMGMRRQGLRPRTRSSSARRRPPPN